MGGLTVMYEIDKQKFGAFVASLRKEKGLTQKELAFLHTKCFFSVADPVAYRQLI